MLVSKTDFSTHKLFVCVFMSHGSKNGIVSAADKKFNLKKTIIDPIMIMRNKSLNGIPKIFITVACRGSGQYRECDGEEFDGHIASTENGIDYSDCILTAHTKVSFVRITSNTLIKEIIHKFSFVKLTGYVSK